MDSYILFINIVLIFVLSLIIASTLINKKDDLKTRLSFCFFFLIVIFNSINNLIVLYFGNHQLIFLLFSFTSFGFLFGPMLLQYVYFLLNQKLPKYWIFNYIFSLLIFIIGLYYLFIPENEQKKYLQGIIEGKNEVLNNLNLIVLLHCFVYFILVKRFIKKINHDQNNTQLGIKKKWALDFVYYMVFCSVLILIIYIILGVFFVEKLVLGDLVFMPLIILSVYSFIVIKSAQQHKEAELNLATSLFENQNKLQEQRLRISRDLHDNIGAQLTFVISSVDNLKYEFDFENKKLDSKLNDISLFAKETIVELRDTVWAMNSDEISYEDLEIRINNYIEKAKLVQENISFSFAIEEKLKTQKLTSVQGMNIYRTIQEAVNNALKYANATVISINAKTFENQIKLTIQDNGIGFNVNKKMAKELATTGNGLNNMKKRIEEIGGQISISSSNEGTIIEILN